MIFVAFVVTICVLCEICGSSFWTVRLDDKLDNIWKALADPTRRQILDLLRDGPRTTNQIVERFPKLSRFGVMKHMAVLKDAGLLLVRADGRERINSLNAVPIRMIYERWVSNYQDLWAGKLVQIMRKAERRNENDQ